jgi:hypothetical protein
MTYTVYSGFEVKGDRLHLKKRGFVLHEDPRPLILDPLPFTYEKWPAIERVHEFKSRQMGTPSPMTKLMGNLHGILLPLR